MAFPSGWAWKSKLTVRAGMISGALSDYPVTVTQDIIRAQAPGMLTLGDIQAAENGGGDVRASLDVAGLVQLPLEVGACVLDANPVNAFATFYIKVPAIANGTEIYLWWGKPGESQPLPSDPFGSEAVWDNDFIFVHHCNNNFDSTVNGINLVNGVNFPTPMGPSLTPIDGGFDFSTGSIPRWLTYSGLGGFAAQVLTIESLLRQNGDLAHTGRVVDIRDAATAESYVFRWQNNGGLDCFNRFYLFDTGGVIHNVEGIFPLTNYIQDVEWFYTAAKYDQNEMKILRSPSQNFDPPSPFIITDISAIVGALTVRQIDSGLYSNSGANYFPSQMSEIRVSKINRSDEWCSATSINLRDNLNFWDMGTPLPGLSGGLIIPVWVPGI